MYIHSSYETLSLSHLKCIAILSVTSVVVQWKVPNYYNAPITMYSLNLREKINDDCTTVNGYPMNINAGEHTSGSIVRYGLLLVIVDVVICSYLHRYNISDLQPLSNPYSLSIRATSMILSRHLISLNQLLLY